MNGRVKEAAERERGGFENCVMARVNRAEANVIGQ
jgi:hypothetical protein